jgi:CheY-like chemotaxis protein
MVYNSSKTTLLYVEDNYIIQMAMLSFLSEEGFDILLADNGTQALHYIFDEKLSIDVLLTDVNIGAGVNGWEVARCARLQVPTMPVVYTSGVCEDEWIANAVPFGRLCRKPFVPSQVISVLSSLLGGGGAGSGGDSHANPCLFAIGSTAVAGPGSGNPGDRADCEHGRRSPWAEAPQIGSLAFGQDLDRPGRRARISSQRFDRIARHREDSTEAEPQPALSDERATVQTPRGDGRIASEVHRNRARPTSRPYGLRARRFQMACVGQMPALPGSTVHRGESLRWLPDCIDRELAAARMEAYAMLLHAIRQRMFPKTKTTGVLCPVVPM